MKIYNKNKVKSEKTLVKLYPDIAKEWHPSKNGDLTPTNVSAGSGKKYWFICKAKAHEYDAVLASRTKKGNECPYCSGHRACEDNCLQIKFPKIAEEWHPTKNGKVLPKDILPGSNKKHWFVCKKKKHEYQARIADRTRRGVNCSFCSGQKACPENCLQSKFPEIAADWHPTKNGTLTPQNVLPGSQKKCWFICKDKGHEYDASLHSKTNKSKNSGSPYCSGHRVGEDNCLQTKRPDVAAEWHPTKNGELTAKDVTPAAGKRIWFLCKKGHEYQSLLGNRTCQGIGCPYCSGAKASKDNCVKSTSLSASREWHPTKNENLTPDNVLPNSNKKVWFICSKNNHEYDMTVYSRIVLGIVCPYCSGHRPSKDICLQSNFPDIASEWHPTKNESLTPQNVLSGSQKKCWFICKDKSHEYESIIGNKTAKNYGCPFCSGRKVCLNNSLQAIFPNIAADWHPTKNGGMTPADVTSASGRTAWFVCKDKGHEYRSVIADRTTKRSQCPYCSGKRVCQDNCLQTLYPNIAKEWHPTKNKQLRPTDLTYCSDKKVYFLCSKKKHTYESRVSSRTIGDTGCPYCSNQKVNIENCLETRFPHIAKTWHPTKNGDITPKDVLPKTNKKYWFLCCDNENHSFKATPNSRTTLNSTECYYCCCGLTTQEKVRNIFQSLLKMDLKKMRPKFLKGLEFDGANEEHKIAFEYDGEFHDKAHYGSKDPARDLKKTKYNDRKKNRLSKKNGWTLIRIHYSQKKRLEEEIIDKLTELGLL